MTNPPHDTRRVWRVPLDGSIQSEVNGCFEAAVLDLSDRGARIEHREVVRPGHQYVMELPLPGVPIPLRLPAYAIWSWVHRFEAGQGTGGLVYHSGLEFRGLTAMGQQALAGFLAPGESQDPEAGSPTAVAVSAR